MENISVYMPYMIDLKGRRNDKSATKPELRLNYYNREPLSFTVYFG